MRIKLATPLIGEFPRYANVKLPDNAAVIAQNMRLDSGVLKPLNGTPTWANSIEVVGTDTNLGTVVGTVTVDFTLDTTNNRLVPTVSATGGQYYQASVRVNSHYNNKV